jgi:predicted phosphate transport protein (TIGR00153 family)
LRSADEFGVAGIAACRRFVGARQALSGEGCQRSGVERLSRATRIAMLGWFNKLMPKEERFFELFVRHAHTVVAGAEALRGVLKGGEQLEHYCQQIFEEETKADEITREVLTAVRRSFITPFDRTDIQDLISRMDDAIDQMNKTAKTILLFEVRNFEPQMQQMGEIILQAAKLVLEALPLLSSIGNNATRLHALTENIIQIEEQADQLHAQGRKALFLASRENRNAMQFIIGNELYDHLEKIVDRFEDVSNEINALVIDHA